MKTIPLVRPPQSAGLKAARVTLSPGEEMGEHVTGGREEIIVVLRGEALLIKENERIRLKEGDVHFIKEGVSHNVRNESSESAEYVYVVSLS